MPYSVEELQKTFSVQGILYIPVLHAVTSKTHKNMYIHDVYSNDVYGKHRFLYTNEKIRPETLNTKITLMHT